MAGLKVSSYGVRVTSCAVRSAGYAFRAASFALQIGPIRVWGARKFPANLVNSIIRG